MRRTTQWAVFTSMNRQQPAARSRFESRAPAVSTDSAVDPASGAAPQPDPEASPAPETRRDRVDFM
jgi:hypothetical protein